MRFLLVLLVAAPLAAVEPWPGTVPAGATAVDERAALTDADGTRLALTVRYPSQLDGPVPVIVFSHGLGGSRSGYAFLGDTWAAHGYVSIHLTHPGSDTSLITSGKSAAGIMQDIRSATKDPKILLGRPHQISTVIDGLPDIERQIPALAGRLDGKRIAVAGHSYGAYTTMMVAGAKLDLPAKPDTTAADPRPLCFLAFSPMGPGPGFDEHAWEGITRPLLMMTGSLDDQPKFLVDPGAVRDGRWRASCFPLLAPGDKWLVWIEGARHSTFSAGAGNRLSGEAVPDPRHFAWIQTMSLAYFDAHLRADPAASRWLSQDAAQLYAPSVRVEQR